MIVLGHAQGLASIAAVVATTGELLGDKTIQVGEGGYAAVLDWARRLRAEGVWALEDCRHVSGAFERFLVVNGERLVRVATRLMAGERRGGRDRGKSDLIDAIASPAPRCERALTGAWRRAGGRRARHPAAGRSPRAPRSDAHRPEQRPALAATRSWARAGPARQRVV